MALRHILAETGAVVGGLSSLVTKDFSLQEGIVYGASLGWTIGACVQGGYKLFNYSTSSTPEEEAEYRRQIRGSRGSSQDEESPL